MELAATPRANRTNTLPLFAALGLLLVAAIVVAAGAWADRAGRATGPESPVTAYASAVERGDLEGALQQLLPGLREPSRAFVAWQLGNQYVILESAIRTVSPLERLLGKTNEGHATVVVLMDVEGKGNPTWRTTEELPVTYAGGRWLLAKTPLELP